MNTPYVGPFMRLMATNDLRDILDLPYTLIESKIQKQQPLDFWYYFAPYSPGNMTRPYHGLFYAYRGSFRDDKLYAERNQFSINSTMFDMDVFNRLVNSLMGIPMEDY